MSGMIELGILLSLNDLASGPLRLFRNTLSETTTSGTNGLTRVGQMLDQVSGKMIALGASS